MNLRNLAFDNDERFLRTFEYIIAHQLHENGIIYMRIII
jgi:hypothetical protein